MSAHAAGVGFVDSPLSYLKVDRYGVFLALLLAGTSLGAAFFVDAVFLEVSSGASPITDRPVSQQATAGGVLAVAEVTIAVVMLMLVYLYRWLPEGVRTVIKKVLKSGVLLGVGGAVANGLGGLTAGFFAFIGTVLALYIAYRIIDYLGLWWMVNNVLAVGIAIVGGAALGYTVGVWFLAVFMVAMTAYDHYFANEKKYMFDVAMPALRARLPIIVLYQAEWRFQWDQFVESVSDINDGNEYDDGEGVGLGTADCLLPAAFVAALVAHSTGSMVAWMPLAAVGVVLAMVVCGFYLRDSMDRKGSGAGLPPITTATFVGAGVFWFIGLAVGVVV